MDVELARSDGVRVSVTGLDDDLVETPQAALEPLDVSKLPGASVVARRGFSRASDAVDVGCARAPSDRWVDGIEGVLFERATALALRSAHVKPDALASAGGSAEAHVLRQRLEGTVGARALVVEHALFFVGDRRDVELCSVVSVGSTRPALDVRGDLRAAPEPGLFMRAVVGTAEHPVAAGVGVAILGALAVAVLLWKRPYPRP
ncbi:MAG TPA: hypothetical protein VL400_04635 [Polyangiaceae bacterium]|nr:hypothetical protein [Polyangiaceae bacterium]